LYRMVLQSVFVDKNCYFTTFCHEICHETNSKKATELLVSRGFLIQIFCHIMQVS
jgi:hypothetical protein